MSQATGTERSPRRGSYLSDKQIVEASKRGRQITFRFPTGQGGEEVKGFVVGMDDYHWFVATPVFLHSAPTNAQRTSIEAHPISLALVHKSTPLIFLDPRPTLDAQEPNVLQAINKIREPFLVSLDQRETP